MLIVFASMRPVESLALRWKDILRDRIVVDKRVYDDEFDDVKTEADKASLSHGRQCHNVAREKASLNRCSPVQS
ncbi:MAG TPA: hypothetical protein VGT08_19235 [Terracidiphilus sp.]|nr:hypothetical protein [Terracidiphilus sp.]